LNSWIGSDFIIFLNLLEFQRNSNHLSSFELNQIKSERNCNRASYRGPSHYPTRKARIGRGHYVLVRLGRGAWCAHWRLVAGPLVTGVGLHDLHVTGKVPLHRKPRGKHGSGELHGEVVAHWCCRGVRGQ
jgi:hypothetical protein